MQGEPVLLARLLQRWRSASSNGLMERLGRSHAEVSRRIGRTAYRKGLGGMWGMRCPPQLRPNQKEREGQTAAAPDGAAEGRPLG